MNTGKLIQIINQSTNFIINLLFPTECLFCQREGILLCPDCLKKIQLAQPPFVFEHQLANLDAIFWAADYHQLILQKTIHFFKFKFFIDLAKPLAKIMIHFYQGQKLTVKYPIAETLIMPVPLNKKRLLERGFNQAELLAKPLAEQFGYPMISDLVIRQKNTAHQVGLTAIERQSNIKNAFIVRRPELIQNKTIILIDDVVTTGSTLEEIAKALKAAGASHVIGLVLAKD